MRQSTRPGRTGAGGARRVCSAMPRTTPGVATLDSACRMLLLAALLVLHAAALAGTDYLPGAAEQEADVEEEEHKGAPWLDSNVPKFVEPLHNVTVPVGRDAVLSCVVDDLSTYKVAWLQVGTQTILTVQTNVITKNHRIALTHTDMRTWYLHIREVREADRGFYMCQVNTDPMKSQVGYLEVVVPPDIWDNQTSSDVEVTEGAFASLSCAATGYPTPSISWRREYGAPFLRGSGVQEGVRQVEGGTLNITNATRSHFGAYLCIASNGVPPTVSKRILLRVQFPPAVAVAKPLVPAVVGDRVTLECMVEAYPKPMGYWTLPNNTSYSKQVVEDTAKEQRTVLLTLNFTSVRPSDYGTYKCVAQNSFGMAEGVVRLYEVKPTTTQPPPTTPRTTTTTRVTTTTTPTPPRRATTPPVDRRKVAHGDKDHADSKHEKNQRGSDPSENSLSGKREASSRGVSRPATASSTSAASGALPHSLVLCWGAVLPLVLRAC